MEPVSTVILGLITSVIYSCGEKGVKATVDMIKSKLRTVITDEDSLDKLSERAVQLEDEHNLETANKFTINQILLNDVALIDFIEMIPNEGVAKQKIGELNQYHYGNGDIVTGDKIVK